MAKANCDKERFVKVYELEAFTKDLKTISDSQTAIASNQTKFEEKVDGRLSEILDKVQGVVTYPQLEKEKRNLYEDIMKDVDYKYGSTNSALKKFTWGVVIGLIGVICQVITFLLLRAYQ